MGLSRKQCLPLGVRVRHPDVLHGGVFLDTFSATFTAQTGLFDATEWCGSVGDHAGVESNETEFDLVGDAPQVAVQGWAEASGVSLWDALGRLADGSPRHLLVTDIGRDGAMSGPNTDLMRKIVATAPDLALQASGGVGRLGDLTALKDAGATAAIVGRALYEGRFTLEAAINAG